MFAFDVKLCVGIKTCAIADMPKYVSFQNSNDIN